MAKRFQLVLTLFFLLVVGWYLTLYLSEWWGPYRVLEAQITLNRCVLPADEWYSKGKALYRSSKEVYLANGVLEEGQETQLVRLDPSDGTCHITTEMVSGEILQFVKPSGKIKFQVLEAQMFSQGQMINKDTVGENIDVLWSFQGLRLKRPVYRIDLIGGGTGWGLSNSHIGRFCLEVHQRKQRLFVLGRSVYGATWVPIVDDSVVLWDPESLILVVLDQVPETGVIYWAQIRD